MSQVAQLTAAFQAVAADVKALQGTTTSATLPAAEVLSAGALVNVWSDAGTPRVRAADAGLGRAAHGFVLEAVAALDDATVYFAGMDDACAGLTPGAQFLAAAGACTSAAPDAAGHTLQCVGVATSATTLFFSPDMPVVLA